MAWARENRCKFRKVGIRKLTEESWRRELAGKEESIEVMEFEISNVITLNALINADHF